MNLSALPAPAAPATPPRPTNPHYLAYCAAMGFPGDPDGMLRHDRAKHLGGTMVGFLLWIRERKVAFLAERGLHADHPLTDAELDAFTAWLAAAAEGTH